MKNASLCLFKSLVAFSLLPNLLLSLPKELSVEAGTAAIHHKNSETMVITTSDKAILNCQSFDINKGEKVQFIQPSSSSTVLNRVSGSNGSKILGNLESNGKVFLVNPNGIYFGKEAVVNVGSLVASTLDITNENFLKDRFSFFLKDKNSLSEIRNEGFLSASPEGAIVLMAPIIRNLGIIQANAGKVVLASGEQVTLDFYGDGLLEFSVEGELKDAVIEHLGSIKAAMGEVAMKLPMAKKVIHEVVNHEGVERGEVFVMEDGVISLVSASSILAKKVEIEAKNIEIAGIVDVSKAENVGGEILVFGENINLVGAEIDASGPLGGGKVLIGGDYQGRGDSPHAKSVIMDGDSIILASAIEEGNGGLVVLWSKDHTIFNGKIFSQGGLKGGDGGIVESSSLGKLTVETPYVNTLALAGHVGQWLLDPSLIRITSGGGVVIPSGCPLGTTSISPATIEGQPTTVALCASIIIQQEPLSMSTSGVGLSFTSPDGDEGVFLIEGSITTKGGAVTITNLKTVVQQPIAIDTTNGGGSSAGANITFGDMNTDGIALPISFEAGTSGLVTLGNLGVLDRFGDVTIQAERAQIKSIFTRDSPIDIACPISLEENVVLSTGVGLGANITLQTVDASTSGLETFTMDAGPLGNIVAGNIGSLTPLGNVYVINAFEAFMGDITTQRGSIDINTAVRLSQSLTTWEILNNINDSYILLSAIDGTTPNAQSLTIITEKRGNIGLGKTGLVIPLDVISVKGGVGVLLGAVNAVSMKIKSHGETIFTRDIVLTGEEGLDVNSFSIKLDSRTFVEKMRLESFASITSESNLQLLTVTTGSLLMNSVIGDIGTFAMPVAINTPNPIKIGANFLASLQGYPLHRASSISYVANNTPCIVIFNQNTILNCEVPSPTRSLSLSRSSFFRSLNYSASRLGIAYNPLLYQNHSINSHFSNIFSISEELGGSSYYRFMGL